MSICPITGQTCDCTGEGDCPHDEYEDPLDPDWDFSEDDDTDFEMRAAQVTYQLDGDRHAT